ncbi:MotA/TolQ/ExbB proton channel family protein [Antarcticirhabdus aurantiaca]|uniref:MotA/TolQ/ExbB proton channel family protein n=1 Tax=Antarcticirhabdus aurantiaca TaxID=2606717 RepID=A0ACD4NUU3_9HYPH|nr:MotA/TolQ/ExbB proton channel family protein [Antarcticirhabdus aurantiaca]WAJ30498.1 MotA/TolQ/ExbB proton channel family protein [Jeongeuplla avenae]
MSAASPPADPPAAPLAIEDGSRLRLGVYLAALLAGLLALGLLDVRAPLALAVLLAAAACLAAGLLLPRPRIAVLRITGLGVALAALLALAGPFAATLGAGQGLAALSGGASFWPHVLVLLFGSRVLAELSDARFSLFWRDPLDPRGRGRAQSIGAACLGGLCLTLLFGHFVGALAVAPGALDPASIVLRAFTGATVVHIAIIALFFTVLAALADAGLRLMEDAAVLSALRRFCQDEVAAGRPLARSALGRLVAQRFFAFSHTRAVQGVIAACLGPNGAGGEPDAAQRTLAAIHLASRRFLRALLSFLPLLGFLGTVIGLTAAIGGLPADLGPEAGARLDIGASLLGLAVKFETTLLGLLGGLLGSLLLALLESRESEIAAECRRLSEVAGDG